MAIHSTGGAATPGRPQRLDPPARPDLLRVPVSEPRPGILVVAPVGEVDMSTAQLLRDAVLGAMDANPRQVVVDLSALTFCGSTGLLVLLQAQQRAAALHVPFCTAGATGTVRRVLEITGLRVALDHRDRIDEVVQQAGES